MMPILAALGSKGGRVRYGCSALRRGRGRGRGHGVSGVDAALWTGLKDGRAVTEMFETRGRAEAGPVHLVADCVRRVHRKKKAGE